MQKKIVALAIAGLVSGAVYAQTNVTIYGRIDASYVYSKSDFRKFQGIEDGNGLNGGASRIGFKGEEALGNGLKAIFLIEYGTPIDIGGTKESTTETDKQGFTARFAYVGLAGSFGTVTAGRIRTPSDDWMGASAVNGISGIEPIANFRGLMGIIGGERWDNSVAYYSPNFSGLDFMAIYSFGEKVNTKKGANGYGCTDATYKINSSGAIVLDKLEACYKGADTSDAGRLGLGVRYSNGPLFLGAVYHAQKDDDGKLPYGSANSIEGYGSKGWGIGGAYDFKVVKVYANYFRVKANHNGKAYDKADGGSDKQATWSLGVGIPVSSAGTVIAEYGQYKDYLNTDAVRSSLPYLDGHEAGHKAKGYTLGYNHILSKRTSLYAYATRINNDRGINASWAKTGVAGQSQTSFVTGIVHLF
jgi:predicted porin